MGNQSGLFGDGEARETAGESSVEGGEARYQRPIRDQIEFDPRSLDMRIPEDHPARMVWETVEKLDFRPFYAEIKAVGGRPGRPAIDPRILFALWVYATLDGVGSARRIADLCEDSTPYQWLCGGVGVNHHALSDFRTQNPEKIKRMMIEHIAVLRVSGLVGLRRVTQDGVKVRAHAGGSSFRRQERLEGFMAEAEAQLAEIERQAANDSGAEQAREKAAAEREARRRVKKLKEANAVLEKLREAKPNPRTSHDDRKDPSQFRASTTDADARIMRMSDGGYRPAYNVQIATDTTIGVVLDVALAATGADQPELVPMLDRLKETYGKEPEEMLVDGGYYTRDGIDHADAVGTKLYMPPPKRKEDSKSTGTPAMQALDGRMETLEAQEIFKQRPRWAEWVNALARNRGLRQVLVRGREKVEASVRWFAIAHNFAVGMANAC